MLDDSTVLWEYVIMKSEHLNIFLHSYKKKSLTQINSKLKKKTLKCNFSACYCSFSIYIFSYIIIVLRNKALLKYISDMFISNFKNNIKISNVKQVKVNNLKVNGS